jgi:hypothetical protein
MNGQIFISYRREESRWSARSLYDRLCAHFDRKQIFMDIDAIALGDDFVKVIEKTVGECDVLIAVIGAHWLTSRDEQGGRRLNNPEDFVRREIATALKREIRVIPVLMDGASMPRSTELPDDLKPLIRRNALQVSDTGFDDDCRRLVAAIRLVLEKTATECREREEKERLETERREPEAKERLETEHREREEKELPETDGRQRQEKERLEAEHSGERQNQDRARPETEHRETEAKERLELLRRRKQEHERLEHEPPSTPAGPVAPSTFLGKKELLWGVGILKVVHPKRWKVPGLKNKRQRWLNRSAVALALLLGTILIGWVMLRVKYTSPKSLISPPSIPIVSSQTASQGKQPAGQSTPSRGESPQKRMSQQETRVAGIVAELSRFVRSGSLITAEVILRNTGSEPVKFSCDDWQLIDEQTGGKSSADLTGGAVSFYTPVTLAPGATHVTWAKFKAQAGDLSGNKYSVNIETILNRPFEGLTLKAAASPQPLKHETRVAGVVAELSRFVRSGSLITAEVILRNTGSEPVKFSCDDWQLIDEQTGGKSSADLTGGVVSFYTPVTLAPEATHVTWAKFKAQAGDLSGKTYSVNIETILNRPFEGLAIKSE